MSYDLCDVLRARCIANSYVRPPMDGHLTKDGYKNIEELILDLEAKDVTIIPYGQFCETFQENLAGDAHWFRMPNFSCDLSSANVGQASAGDLEISRLYDALDVKRRTICRDTGYTITQKMHGDAIQWNVYDYSDIYSDGFDYIIDFEPIIEKDGKSTSKQLPAKKIERSTSATQCSWRKPYIPEQNTALKPVSAEVTHNAMVNQAGEPSGQFEPSTQLTSTYYSLVSDE